MYEIINKDTIYVAGYFGWRKQYQVYEVGNERALIQYLANSYEDLSVYFDEPYYRNDAYDKDKVYFDGYGREINPRAYEEDAFALYLEQSAKKDKISQNHYIKNKIYQGVFRETPVPYTGKHARWCPSIRARRVKHLHAMYANPEYKDFNRGSHKLVPAGWWDDWDRCVERNWKSQGKHRHQWERDTYE